ncbi:MAG: EutN/CcmL family microcompartment protein [Acidobacteriota bacterium]|nr:EutN/CcmL family microcompartment protein [Acidobacteriota bacterium]
MQLARVIGDVVATRKDPGFDGAPLLLLQPISADGKNAGRPLVAVDSVGAGVGETVFFVRGKEASFPFHPTEMAADAGIVGIVDQPQIYTVDQPQIDTVASHRLTPIKHR